MPDLSPELNLALAAGGDDTADYLRNPSTSLRSSLQTIDGLFNAATGHSHSGAHQGGALRFQDMTVNGNLNVVGNSDLHGATHLYSTILVDGAATLSSTLAVTGVTTLNSNLSVAGSTTLQGVTVNGTVGIAGSLTVNGNIGGGDTTSSRSATTGYFFMGSNNGHYIGFDGNYFQLAGSAILYVGGDRAVTENAGQNLANKTLATPTINGAAAWNAAQNFVAQSKQNGLNLLAVANANDWVVDYGGSPLVSVPNGGLANQAYSFNRVFTTPPYVMVSLGFYSGTSNTLHQVQVAAHGITTSGLQIDFGNATGGTQTLVANWIAIGR